MCGSGRPKPSQAVCIETGVVPVPAMCLRSRSKCALSRGAYKVTAFRMSSERQDRCRDGYIWICSCDLKLSSTACRGSMAADEADFVQLTKGPVHPLLYMSALAMHSTGVSTNAAALQTTRQLVLNQTALASCSARIFSTYLVLCTAKCMHAHQNSRNFRIHHHL